MERKLVLSSVLGVNDYYAEMSKQMIIHYSRYPISELVLTLNGSDEQIQNFKDFLSGFNIKMKLFEKNQEYDNRKQARWANQRQSYIRSCYHDNDWKITVDGDEIIILNETLCDVLDHTGVCQASCRLN
jgi:hypothetical protein